MPTTYRFDVAHRLVWSRFWGRITVEEMEAHSLALRADPRFDGAGRQLLTFVDADPTLITLSGVRRVASLAGWGPGSRRALVMRTQVGLGLGRQYAVMSGRILGEEVAAYRDLAEALAWLGLPPDWEPPPPSPDDPVFEAPPG